jgi:hypothetical protein
MFTCTQEEFADHVDSHDGFCKSCQDFTRFGMTEPDAEDYECPDCEKNECVGAENALIMGLVEFEED